MINVLQIKPGKLYRFKLNVANVDAPILFLNEGIRTPDSKLPYGAIILILKQLINNDFNFSFLYKDGHYNVLFNIDDRFEEIK